MKAKQLPPLAELQAAFIYNPTTGTITNKKTGKVWDSNSCPSQSYISITYKRKAILLSRVAWKLMTGEEPTAVVDHINEDKKDNRWVNLQLLTLGENTRKHHRLTAKNYCYCPSEGKWNAQMRCHGQTIWLGWHKTEEEASDAVRLWRDGTPLNLPA